MSVSDLGKHFKDLFEKTSDLIHFADLEGNIQVANNAWLVALGYTLEEIVGKSIFEFVDPEILEEFKTYREQIIHGIDPGVVRLTLLTKSGSKINLEGLVGVSYENGEVKYTRGVFRNITEKYLIEKRLQTLFNNAPDAIIVINEHEEILEWNPKAEVIFGYSYTEVKGKTLTQTIIPEPYRAAHLRGMKHFLKTGEGPVLNKLIEVSAMNKEGKEFDIALSVSNVKLHGAWLFIAFISDITARKRIEADLIHKEAELLHARLMEERKDEFISIASHELKTPLTTIKAYTQIALHASIKSGTSQVTQHLEKVNEYTSKLTNLINELLMYQKYRRVNYWSIKLNRISVITFPVCWIPFNI